MNRAQLQLIYMLSDISETLEAIVIVLAHACLGMLSVRVDHTFGEAESRYAIAVDSNSVQLITLRITSGCRGILSFGRSAW